MSDKLYTQKEWDRVVGYGTVPPERNLELHPEKRQAAAGSPLPSSGRSQSSFTTDKGVTSGVSQIKYH